MQYITKSNTINLILSLNICLRQNFYQLHNSIAWVRPTQKTVKPFSGVRWRCWSRYSRFLFVTFNLKSFYSLRVFLLCFSFDKIKEIIGHKIIRSVYLAGLSIFLPYYPGYKAKALFPVQCHPWPYKQCLSIPH